MSRPCVCAGSNENCRYCSGRGEIPDRLADALTVHSHRPESRKLKTGNKKATAVSSKAHDNALCKLKALIAKRERLRAIVSGKWDSLSTSAPSRASLLVACPAGCGAWLAAYDIQQHVKAAHAAISFRARGKRVRASRPKEEFTVCKVCSAQVKARNLDRHLRKVHPPRSRARSKPSNSRTERAAPGKATFAAPREKNLDATRLYAHSYREHGRFGSHPSHDGFDDDSGPD